MLTRPRILNISTDIPNDTSTEGSISVVLENGISAADGFNLVGGLRQIALDFTATNISESQRNNKLLIEVEQLRHKYLMNYMNQLKADPIYQGIELDKLLSPKADEAVLSSEFGNSVQDFYDNENKKYIQKDLKTPFNASDYKLIEPFEPLLQETFVFVEDNVGGVHEQSFNTTEVDAISVQPFA